jgi:hypothetical protein
VQVPRLAWDGLRAAAAERAVLLHEKVDLEQQLLGLADALGAARAVARDGEVKAAETQASNTCALLTAIG